MAMLVEQTRQRLQSFSGMSVSWLRVGSWANELTAAAAGLVFAVVGYLQLHFAHPAEDAYILFRYAEHVAHGAGIVFNAGGPHAEGATDFLWMLSLAGFVAVGVDVAVAALLLNAIGAGLAAYVLLRALDSWAALNGARYWLKSVAVVVLITTLPGAAASYGGFDTMLYAALTLLGVHWLVVADSARLHLLPVMALVLGLIRPDGALMGAALVLAGGLRAPGLSAVRPYMKSLLLAASVGAAYYVWRYHYFGLPLPLPLYVKARAGNLDKFSSWPTSLRVLFSALPGLAANLHWLFAGGAPGSLVVGIGASVGLASTRGERIAWSRCAAVLPYAILWAGLCAAYQTQNIAWRFQAPIQLGALYFSLRAVGALLRRRLVTMSHALFLGGIAILPSVWSGASHVLGNYQLSRGTNEYVSVFSKHYRRELLAGTRAAVGEAGRFPFWSDVDVLDTVGLNTRETALRPITKSLLEKFAPQIVFFNHSGVLDTGQLSRAAQVVSLDSPAAWVRPDYASFMTRDFAEYTMPIPSTALAPIVLLDYLQKHRDGYAVVIVDAYGDGSYADVWAFRKDLDVKRALQLLKESLQAPMPYLALAAERP